MPLICAFSFCRFNTHPKGQLLYESRLLVTARYSSDGTYTYLRGQCKASMKSLTYVVDLKVSHEGSIEECHCECAAGSGTEASCKHVAVLLLGAHDIDNKSYILSHQVCTQQLMMFLTSLKRYFKNHPLLHTIYPARCNYEPLKREDIIQIMRGIWP
jgi:hypothetical protein